MLKLLRSDYTRHGSRLTNPALWAVWNYHFGVWAANRRFPPFRWMLLRCYSWNLFLVLITSGICLYRETEIGADLHLIHSGNIQIHPRAIVGARCGIQQDVTIGTNMGTGVPVIGDDVYIGAGAKLLGDITIGDGAVIAANSLVISDVPPHTTAIGVPARVWKQPAAGKQARGQQKAR